MKTENVTKSATVSFGHLQSHTFWMNLRQTTSVNNVVPDKIQCNRSYGRRRRRAWGAFSEFPGFRCQPEWFNPDPVSNWVPPLKRHQEIKQAQLAVSTQIELHGLWMMHYCRYLDVFDSQNSVDTILDENQSNGEAPTCCKDNNIWGRTVAPGSQKLLRLSCLVLYLNELCNFLWELHEFFWVVWIATNCIAMDW